MTFHLSQSSIEVDQKWAITGSVTDNHSEVICTQAVNGTLDEDGDLQLLMSAGGGCGRWGVAYKIVDARCDVTSQGYFWEPDHPDWHPAPAANYRNFLNQPGTWAIQPMAKQLSDFPNRETSSICGSVGACTNSWSYANPIFGTGNTQARWIQTISSPVSTVNFGGRLVYESDDALTGTHDDTCYFTDSAVPKIDHMSGGAWWVDANSKWGFDWIGFPSNSVDYYRGANVGGHQGVLRAPCHYTFPQAMYIDFNTTGNPYHYVTNQLLYSIDEEAAVTVCSVRNEPVGAAPQKECTNYTTH